jgi:phosphoribosylcarboxyaminoimidazole (NCAIR) mutase
MSTICSLLNFLIDAKIYSENQRSIMRKIVVMVGSDNDLVQCENGLLYLAEKQEKGIVEVKQVITASIHRNTMAVINALYTLRDDKVDVLIAGAGKANHLTGTCDAILRYMIKDCRIVVVGCVFYLVDNMTDVTAGMLSISRVPNTQVVFNSYFGSDGFFNACVYAATAELPKIRIPEIKLPEFRTPFEALEAIKKLKQKEQ